MKYVYNVHFYRHLNMINVCLFIYTILSPIIFIYCIFKYSLGIGYSSVQENYQKSLENSFTKKIYRYGISKVVLFLRKNQFQHSIPKIYLESTRSQTKFHKVHLKHSAASIIRFGLLHRSAGSLLTNRRTRSRHGASLNPNKSTLRHLSSRTGSQ